MRLWLWQWLWIVPEVKNFFLILRSASSEKLEHHQKSFSILKFEDAGLQVGLSILNLKRKYERGIPSGSGRCSWVSN